MRVVEALAGSETAGGRQEAALTKRRIAGDGRRGHGREGGRRSSAGPGTWPGKVSSRGEE